MITEYYVYQLRIEGEILPFYIGKGKGYRLNVHFMPSSLKIKNIKNNIIKKALGLGQNVISEKISENLTEVESCLIEVFLIKCYGRKDLKTGCLANMTDGGEGTSGREPSAGHREKVSQSNKGKRKSCDARRKMSESKMGKKIAPDVVARRSAKCRGQKRTEETKQKMSKSYVEVPHQKCKYCDKVMSPKLLGRWHNENVKIKENYSNDALTNSAKSK